MLLRDSVCLIVEGIAAIDTFEEVCDQPGDQHLSPSWLPAVPLLVGN